MSTADGLGKSYLVLVSAGPGTIAVVVDMRTSAVDRPWYFRLDDREFENEIGDGLSYRIFSENQVVFQSGGAAYKYFNEGELSERMSLFNQDELTVRMSDARKLIIAGPDYSFGRLLTNFSFYVFIAFVLLATVRLVQMLLHRMSGQILSYTGRIQLYLAMAFVLPMVITSIAAIRNVSLEDEGQITDQHRKKVLALATEVGRQSVAGIAPSRDQLVNTGILSDDGYILYDLNGRRLFSNEPELLESSLMPQFMNPIALERMRQGLPYTAIREEVAGYDYQGTYTVIKAGIPAVPVAWLHVPNFDYYASAERARIGVIMSILPIAVLVFTVFLLVSYQLSARLTHPIRDISRALRKGSLSGIKFQREGTNSDEIGKLMEAYDQMMTGLEKSKNELLANQRDADWRNMARQVAHEIRNPLTPIRLKLQWLQRQLKEGVHDPKQASASIDTILAQTDILSGIAGSFSALAGFPKLKPEVFDLTAETARTIDLFSGHSGGSIRLNTTDSPVLVEFDRPFYSRILSNLILNAVQSRRGEVRVEVTIRKAESKAIITVKDDGEGIDAALGDQIFLPRFTTKPDGSGLGLAIARQGLDQAGGKIWYRSVPGAG
ncbi:MAG: ATP-binding protein, partial [Bacteroidota bacterium]